MAPRFCPLRDDEVDAAVDHANGLLHGRDHRADVNVRLVCSRYERCRVSEREAQHRDALREADVDLLGELRGGIDDVAGASGQAQFGAQRSRTDCTDSMSPPDSGGAIRKLTPKGAAVRLRIAAMDAASRSGGTPLPA